MQVTVQQASALIARYLRARLVPMLVGSPGVGKSGIVHQIAREYGLQVIDLRLSQCDPTDLLGFPTITGARAGYAPMETFPVEGDPLPDGHSGWLLFLDEFNSGAPAVQAAAYKLVLDRMVGIHPLHRNVAIVCAGNLESDNAIVQPMSTALQSRLAHLELAIDAREWVDWAQRHGIDHRITDYIQFQPASLDTFRPDHTDKTYACPRTWEFASRVLAVTEDGSAERLPMLAGVLSEGVAREFLAFCQVYDQLPKPAQLVSSPETIAVPTEPSILYAMTGTLSHHATHDNFTQLMRFIRRLPAEFQVVTLRETVRRDKSMLAHPEVEQWIAHSAASLF